MRLPFFLTAFLGCALAAAAVPVSAATTCSSEADQSAYDVLTLRTMMILLATKCGHDQDYNKNFIVRFQPALQSNEREVIAYFRRIYGRAGQARKDTFSTELVNVMSQQANLQGAEFCPRALWIVSEMNALRTLDELAPYAAVKDLSPVGMSMCPPGAPRSESRPTRRRAPRHR
jgi:hypothetical protein